MLPRGVIFYNTGTKLLTRLLVAVYSLRKHYHGPITILTEGQESTEFCQKMAVLADIKPVTFTIPEGAQPAYLKKTLLYQVTPYDLNIFIDCDCLIRGDISELFTLAEKHQFVATHFSNWRSDGRTLQKRIRAWQHLYPEQMQKAIAFGPALNAGVYAFRNDAEFLRYWYDLTLPGRHINLPEETCMQVHLHRFPHVVADQKYNCSCKHSDPHHTDVRIIHYHGRKHCRPGLPYGADLWMKAFEELEHTDAANISAWATMHDRYLRSYRRQAPPPEEPEESEE